MKENKKSTASAKDKDGRTGSYSTETHTESQHNMYGFDPAIDAERENVDWHRFKESQNIWRDRSWQTHELNARNENFADTFMPIIPTGSLFDAAQNARSNQFYYLKEAEYMAKKENKSRGKKKDEFKDKKDVAQHNADQAGREADYYEKELERARSNNDKTRDARRNTRQQGGIQSDNAYKHFAAPGNDFAWWNRFPNLMKDAVGLRPNHLAGTLVYDDKYLPSVLLIEQLDCYGNDASATDPFNVCIRDLFLKLFQKYRGVTQYQSSDLGVVIIAGLEIIKTLNCIERIYGIVNRYSKTNYNMPLVELAALGVDESRADLIRRNLAQFRSRFNYYINKVQRMCLPKDLSILLYYLSVYGGEFLDHDSDRAQIIMYNPTHFGIFNELELEAGSSIDFEPYEITRLIQIQEVDGVVQFDFPLLNEQIESLLGSDGVQRIYGDLLAWFGESQMIIPTELPEGYVVVPAYQESILHKLHNTFLCEVFYDGMHFTPGITVGIPANMKTTDKDKVSKLGHHFTIFQCENIIYSKLGFSFNSEAKTQATVAGLTYTIGDVAGNNVTQSMIKLSNKQILDGYHQEWSDEFVCEGLMVKPMFRNDTGVGNLLLPVSNNISIAMNMKVFTRYGNAGVSSQDVHTFVPDTTSLASLCDILVFDWYPLLYLCDAGSGEFINVLSDVDMFRRVDAYTKEPLDRAITLSAFTSDVSVLK